MNQRRLNAFNIIAVAASTLMIALSFFAKAGSTYRFSFAFMLPLLWGVYALRCRLFLRPTHFALITSALLLHNLGVFGFYRREFFHLQFDTYVHFYFGFCGAFILRHALEMGYGIGGWRVWVAVMLGLLGFGAFHELIEWASTMALGPERGMLKALAEDPYDTQKDLLNNLLGTLLSLIVSSALRRRRPRATMRTEKRFHSSPA
jgi:uncharacterized membrane protein YjdF